MFSYPDCDILLFLNVRGYVAEILYRQNIVAARDVAPPMSTLVHGHDNHDPSSKTVLLLKKDWFGLSVKVQTSLL